MQVSTHSRPKVAGGWSKVKTTAWTGFNTQPPEGGWEKLHFAKLQSETVSTHSRPKVAGSFLCVDLMTCLVSTHSRPKVAGLTYRIKRGIWNSFNTQPPEGGWAICQTSFYKQS